MKQPACVQPAHPAAFACGTSHLKLSGTETVSTCSPLQGSPDCIYVGQVLHEYMQAVPDSDSVFSIGLQSSPWRLYDGEFRILTVDEVADAVRSNRNGKVERVVLVGSWTGVSPEPRALSLADRVSKALDGLPVEGEDGFLWLAQDGKRRTTRQAFTLREGAGAYFLPKGSEVFVPLAAGWPAFVEDQIPDGGDAELQMRAAVGWDVFFLCPDKALAGFERAAEQDSAVAAYNAALMRLERRAEGDRDAAIALLERGGRCKVQGTTWCRTSRNERRKVS